jgi:hypothetical protein
MRSVIYKSHGVPLEEYALTKQDHRNQGQSEQIKEWANKEVEKHRQIEEAQEALDPELRERRAKHRSETLEKLALLLKPTPEDQLMRWRVRLYCGHIIETRCHRETDAPNRHGSSSQKCPECHKDPSLIVAYEPLGMLKEPAHEKTFHSDTTKRKPTRAELERKISDLEEEV